MVGPAAGRDGRGCAWGFTGGLGGAAHQATLSALLSLKRLSDWQAGAGEATADLSGRTPARLIDCLARWPLVSAPLAEAETGASRAAVQHNLDLLVARGMAREVTGQGRYRVWAATVEGIAAATTIHRGQLMPGLRQSLQIASLAL